MTVRLRAVLRRCIPAEVIHAFVELGQTLEDNLIRERLNWCSESNSSRRVASSTLLTRPTGKLEFEQWERRLW